VGDAGSIWFVDRHQERRAGARARRVEAKKRALLAVLAVVVVDGIIEGLLSVPWDAYARWWRRRAMA